MSDVAPIDLDRLSFAKGDGLVTVVTVDDRSGDVLMVAHADRDALERTLATGEMHYRSRTRGLWRKGETSGNTQRVVVLAVDCDGDAVLARVVPAGPACHSGTASCFGEAARTPDGDILSELDRVIAQRKLDMMAPGTGKGAERTSYTMRLLGDRNLRLKKLGEESAELIAACADANAARAIEEAADLIYHALVALRALGSGLEDVRWALERRSRPAVG